jgi:hypothetical protein
VCEIARCARWSMSPAVSACQLECSSTHPMHAGRAGLAAPCGRGTANTRRTNAAPCQSRKSHDRARTDPISSHRRPSGERGADWRTRTRSTRSDLARHGRFQEAPSRLGGSRRTTRRERSPLAGTSGGGLPIARLFAVDVTRIVRCRTMRPSARSAKASEWSRMEPVTLMLPASIPPGGWAFAREPLDRTAPPLVVEQLLSEAAVRMRSDGAPPERGGRHVRVPLAYLPFSRVCREDPTCRYHGRPRGAFEARRTQPCPKRHRWPRACSCGGVHHAVLLVEAGGCARRSRRHRLDDAARSARAISSSARRFFTSIADRTDASTRS